MIELKVNLDKFEKFILEFVNRDIELYTIVKYQLGFTDEYGQDSNNSVIKERNFVSNLLASIAVINSFNFLTTVF